eukprot:IDg10750t1
MRRVTLRTLRDKYKRGEPITMVTAYDYASGVHVDTAGGGRCVGGRFAGDGGAGRTDDTGRNAGGHVRSAVTLVKDAAVDAVKLEGARAHAVRAICNAGVAVMGHVGLAPQSYSALGGFRAVGRDAGEAARVLDDALAVQDAGAFALVVECVPAKVAEAVSRALDIPTIGIGAGPGCDGQVLVYHDLLGINNGVTPPSFAKQYSNVGDTIHRALEEFNNEVRGKLFPDQAHSGYSIDTEELQKFLVHAQQKRKEPNDGLQSRKKVDDEDMFKLY